MEKWNVMRPGQHVTAAVAVKDTEEEAQETCDRMNADRNMTAKGYYVEKRTA